jgi:hypothetical protein
MRHRTVLRTLIAPIVLVLATIYFVLDALVLSILRPLLRYFAHLRFFHTARRWIESLSPYATLAIFLIPVVILEPVKPLSAYLIATGHFVTGVVLLICGELLKITIVERIFHIARPQLMTITAFAWTYNFVVGWLMWLQALPPWQEIKRRFADFRYWIRKLKRSGQSLKEHG